MQAIILAAGKGTRFEPLSLTKPKPLFSVFGESILEHNLKQLKGLVKEVIIIVNYKRELIEKLIGKEFEGIKITYIFQKDLDGTGGGIKLAESLIKDKFLLLNGDDFYFKEDVEQALKRFPCVLVEENKNPSNFGVIIEEEGFVRSIIEKPENPLSNLVNTGLYFLPKSILNKEIQKSERGEYEFTDFIKSFIKNNRLYSVKAKNWFPASYPWDIFNALDFFFSKKKKSLKIKKEKNVIIKDKLIVGQGTLIKSGAYIEGPAYIGNNCIIGPNCFIRANTIIGNNCKIGQAVEIKNSIIGNNVNINHLSYIGDSIIGDNCNLGAGTIIANLKHNGETIETMVNEKMIDTKRNKFGTIVGDNSKTGIGTLIYPGRKIWPGKNTLPGEKIKEDLK
ncbi:MAG: sugar phosphate nucleotidyltransferase [Candidatus Pacebacteria bacterium]|jgi:bifunctional UDP-N-acetylglucosamine pyrophosphorylase/glucosamine-1-phosphate N-acetyltransferase|nr:sugar phosphate nucleotidyltransferase [Candidatus Paceibacterota bacterium]MDD5012785.1 sugar phosphate nucleotidyltransferase [Candidatus Paceibacterota bacterium]MDD5752835.1 sugar phosphate nucleotidyltransferase [Candidatus Paceibacterota bacterium]